MWKTQCGWYLHWVVHPATLDMQICKPIAAQRTTTACLIQAVRRLPLVLMILQNICNLITGWEPHCGNQIWLTGHLLRILAPTINTYRRYNHIMNGQLGTLWPSILSDFHLGRNYSINFVKGPPLLASIEVPCCPQAPKSSSKAAQRTPEMFNIYIYTYSTTCIPTHF